MSDIALPRPLKRLQRLLGDEPIYVVGGYVRNALLWRAVDGTDIDICGALTVAQLRAAIDDASVEIIPVNPRVGTVLIRIDGCAFEYTTFRRDSYPIGGVHTPSEVTFVSTVEEDALRRDFKVNALYVNVITGRLADPTGGLADLDAHVLSTTRAARLVFAEDGLRILRMVRFCAELGFAPAQETYSVAGAMRAQLADISPERRREELDKILLSDQRYGVQGAPDKGLSLLGRLGLWQYLLGRDVPATDVACLPPRLDVRLAAVCLAAFPAEGIEGAVRAALGNEGLRYANRTVDSVVQLIAAYPVPATEEGWRKWALRYGVRLAAVCALWRDPALTSRAQSVARSLERAGVPRSHKDLPLAPAEIEALGVPRQVLGKVMQRVVEICACRLLRPTKEQCQQIVYDIKREKQWN
jgi:hypothetical protein